MGTSEALSFAAAAPFITAIIAFVKNSTPLNLPAKLIPLITMALAFAWGGVLVVSGYYDADPAVFIVTAITVGFASNGIQSVQKAVTAPSA